MQGTTIEVIFRNAVSSVRCWTTILALCAAASAFLELAHAGAPVEADKAMPTEPSRWIDRSPASRHVFSKSLDKRPVAPVSDNWDERFGLKTSFVVVDGVGGERIDHVELGSLAKGMNLAPGDMIVALNGTALSNADSWGNAVERVARLGGWLTLKIHIGPTGAVAYRTGNLQVSRGR